MVTTVSQFIEQVGSMIKGASKHTLSSINPSNFKDPAQTLVSNLYQFIGNYPVPNQIISSRWMHMNWYLLASRKAWWIVGGGGGELIDDNCVLITCSMNPETAVTLTTGHCIFCTS